MRKKLTAVILAVLVFSLIAASAASMTAPGEAGVGVANQVIAACDDTGGWDVDYNIGWAGGEFKIQSADITGLDSACDGSDVAIRLFDSGGTNLGPMGTNVAPVSGGAATVTGLNGSALLAEEAVIAVSG